MQKPTDSGALTDSPGLDEIQREYLEDLKCRVSLSHYKNVKSRLARTFADLNMTRLDELQPLQLIRYRNQHRADGASNRTANLIVDNIGAMLAWALGCGLIETNPLRNVRRLPDGAGNQRYRRRALTDAEIDQFLKAAEDDDRDTAELWFVKGGGESNHRRSETRVPQAPMWMAFLETGARWSELTRTRWADWDLGGRTLTLRAENTKSKKRRVLPLREKLVSTIQTLVAVHTRILGHEPETGDPVFLSPEASRWMKPTNNAMRVFNRILKRAGIPRLDAEGRKLDIHSLRHTFGSRLARHGVGLVQVQRLMGHSDPKLTAQVYTHLDVEDLRRAVETV
ncbi:MAG: site-specific integrase [Planctomycetota bacterium]